MKAAAEQTAEREYLERGLSTLNSSLAQLRALAGDPLQVVERNRDLRSAFESEARLAGIVIEFEVFGEPAWLTRDEVELVFLAGREGIRNVMRHSGSRRCRGVLDLSECPVSFSLRDWGAGTGSGYSEGQGLAGLRELAQSLGWHLELRSMPGMGVELMLVGRACPSVSWVPPEGRVAKSDEAQPERKRDAASTPAGAS